MQIYLVYANTRGHKHKGSGKRPKPWDESTKPLFEAKGLHGKPKGLLCKRPRLWDKTKDNNDEVDDRKDLARELHTPKQTAYTK